MTVSAEWLRPAVLEVLCQHELRREWRHMPWGAEKFAWFCFDPLTRRVCIALPEGDAATSVWEEHVASAIAEHLAEALRHRDD